jgi:hypothetical protein
MGREFVFSPTKNATKHLDKAITVIQKLIPVSACHLKSFANVCVSYLPIPLQSILVAY